MSARCSAPVSRCSCGPSTLLDDSFPFSCWVFESFAFRFASSTSNFLPPLPFPLRCHLASALRVLLHRLQGTSLHNHIASPPQRVHLRPFVDALMVQIIWPLRSVSLNWFEKDEPVGVLLMPHVAPRNSEAKRTEFRLLFLSSPPRFVEHQN